MSPEAILFVWEGDGFKPANAFWQKRADKLFTIGQRYALVEEQERSSASHRAYFASVNEAHKNLPDELAERFPSPDHLRRYALIKAGFCDSHTLVCASHTAATRTAQFIKPLDEFSIVDVKGATVTVYRAHSQKYRSMDKATFQRSKEEVLRIIAEMLGTSTKALEESRAA